MSFAHIIVIAHELLHGYIEVRVVDEIDSYDALMNCMLIIVPACEIITCRQLYYLDAVPHEGGGCGGDDRNERVMA